MTYTQKLIKSLVAYVAILFVTGAVHATPALQLGPGTGGGWVYNGSTQTWVLDGDGSLAAYANADLTGNGDYAWDPLGDTDQFAYLVIAATPKSNDATDLFDITVENDAVALTLFDFGFGNPPIEDQNSMGPHGIFSTYFEIYQFMFDDTVGLIGNTQPGDDGTAQGYQELFDITINGISDSVSSLHFDLFTTIDDGNYTVGFLDKSLVHSVAPFSHDAEFNVPEPGTLVLMGIGLLGLGFSRRKTI